MLNMSHSENLFIIWRMFLNNESLLKFSINKRTNFYHDKTYLDCKRYCFKTLWIVEKKYGVIKLSIQQEIRLKVTIKIELVSKIKGVKTKQSSYSVSKLIIYIKWT